MNAEIPAVISGSFLKAKEAKFPDSVFAVEIIDYWLWNFVEETGNPANTPKVVEILEKLGIGYETLLELGQKTKRAELDRCMAVAPTSPEAFLQACAMVCSTNLIDAHERTYVCEWNEWSGFDPDDLVSVPRERLGIFRSHQDLPFEVVSMIAQYTPRAGNPFVEFGELVNGYFKFHREKFCYPRAALDDIDRDYSPVKS